MAVPSLVKGCLGLASMNRFLWLKMWMKQSLFADGAGQLAITQASLYSVLAKINL